MTNDTTESRYSVKSITALFKRNKDKKDKKEGIGDGDHALAQTEKDRGQWGRQLEFLLACLGFCVGLGNLWRFPFKCYKNGGGAFLIPYVIMLLLAGIPMEMLEMSIGQYTSRGPIKCWNCVPIFRGIGVAMVIVAFLVSIYYNVIIAWILYYLFVSFTDKLPWVGCDNEWNTPKCSGSYETCLKSGGLMDNYTCIFNATEAQSTNLTQVAWVSASEEFWKYVVLGESDGLETIGTIQWHLVLALAVSWLFVFLCLLKGVKSSGKVVYVTATLPYLLLLILLGEGLSLPGCFEGIKFYITPQWEKLLEPAVWGDAACQIFYSLGLAFGSLITMASYNKYSNNICRDAIIVSTMNCGTSFLGGFVIFSIIGFMSHETGRPVDQVVQDGPGLAFIVYPEAVARLPAPPVWSVIFFTMLLMLGVDSQFAQFETVTTAVMDQIPSLRKHKALVCGVLCFFCFLLGLPMVAQGGIYLFTLTDWYSAGFSLMVICLCELAVVGYFYGVTRFSLDIKSMIGFSPPLFFKIGWMGLTAVVILAILIFNIYAFTPATYGDYEYPGWGEALGILMALTSILSIPAFAVYEIIRAEGSLMERVRSLLVPVPNWGPVSEANRAKSDKLLIRAGLMSIDESIRDDYGRQNGDNYLTRM